MTSTLAPPDIIRAALYQRVSTKDQDHERQNTENREVAAREGWAAAEYADKESASRFAGRNGGEHREDWQRLLNDITSGGVDVLILWEPSRGDRQLAGWANLLGLCRRHGVLIHITSHRKTYDLSIAREWRNLAEDGIDSEFESEKISMRVLSGKADGRRAGRPQGSVAYGVHRVRDPEKTRRAFLRDEPDPVTGPVVARIIREVGRGTPYKDIADTLQADSVPTPSAAMGRQRQAGAWNQTTVTRIAGNPVYVGAGVVTQAESDAARARVAASARLNAGKGERPRIQRFRYSQVLTCAACGALIRGATRSGKDRYLCPAGHVSILCSEADPWIDMAAIARLSQPDLIGLFRDTDTAAAAEARAEAAKCRRKIANATASYNADRIDLTTLEEITAVNRPKAEAAEKRARDAEMPAVLTGLPDEDREVVRARWESLTLSARKAALRVLAPHAVALPAGVKGSRRVPVDDRIVLWPEPRATVSRAR